MDTKIKVISGGQTGADQGGLEAAKELEVPTGGYAPKGWLTETGSSKELLESFGLKECQGGCSYAQCYRERTLLNGRDADLTLWFGNTCSAGYFVTKRGAVQIISVEDLDPHHIVEIIKNRKVKVLNIAGNRESKNPGIQERTKKFMIEVLKELKLKEE